MTRKDFDKKMVANYGMLADQLGGNFLNRDAMHDAYCSLLTKVEQVEDNTFFKQFKYEYNVMLSAYYKHEYNRLEFDESYMSKTSDEDFTEEQKEWRRIELEKFRLQAERRMARMPQIATDCIRLKAKGWSVYGIANYLGMTPNAVSKLIERATQSLAQKITPPPFIYLIYNKLWN